MERGTVTTLAPQQQQMPSVGTNAMTRFNPQDLWPRTWEEAKQLSIVLAKSGLLPKHLQGNEANTFYTVLAGLELGVAPLVACREIYLVDGRPSCSSLLKVGLVRGSGLCEKWQEVKSNNEECSYIARRAGDKGDTVRTFTIKDAERAGLTGKDNWRKWPAAMLRRRAQGQLADDLFPDVVKGLGSSDEEAPLSAEEMKWAERVSPPPPPGGPSKATEAKVEVVDDKTGEVSEVVQEPAADELGFEALSAALGAAGTRDQLQSIAKKVDEAKRNNRLQPDQVAILTEIYKAKRKALEVANG